MGCHGNQPKNTGDLVPLAGSWKGRQIARFDRPFSELILFAWKPDSSLVQSLVFETGPRSRLWIGDEDVALEGGTVRWTDQEGTLSKDKDSMRVVGGTRGEGAIWQFVRDRSADSLMNQLYADISRPYVYRMPEVRNDSWQCADLAASGIDKTKIVELVDEILQGEHDDIHSLLIVKNNKLVVEEYFAGNGSKHSPFISTLFRDKVHHLASTTKAITSALVGIAIDRGFIKGVEDPIYQYLPAYDSLFSEDKRWKRS